VRVAYWLAGLACAAGAAQAGVLPIGHKGAKGDDERVCVTTTTVVRRGDVVLSTTSNTRCEDDHSQATAGPAASPSAPAAAAGASPASPARPFGEPSVLASFFGARPVELTPRDVLGVWTALERGREDGCQVRMTREAFSGGFRVLASGCRGPFHAATAWRFDGATANVYRADGTLLSKLTGDKAHLAGPLPDGGAVDLTR
jgi:hypothetical protein